MNIVRAIICASSLLLAMPATAQQKHTKPRPRSKGVIAISAPPEVYTYVEQQPEYAGGTAALNKFLDEHLYYPDVARENEVTGKVLVRFLVDEEGTVTHVKVVKGIGYGCDEEALRVVKAMPRWHPGKVNGKPVRTMYLLPIVFRINN